MYMFIVGSETLLN